VGEKLSGYNRMKERGSKGHEFSEGKGGMIETIGRRGGYSRYRKNRERPLRGNVTVMFWQHGKDFNL
jgi:hypothetical protein